MSNLIAALLIGLIVVVGIVWVICLLMLPFYLTWAMSELTTFLLGRKCCWCKHCTCTGKPIE